MYIERRIALLACVLLASCAAAPVPAPTAALAPKAPATLPAAGYLPGDAIDILAVLPPEVTRDCPRD